VFRSKEIPDGREEELVAPRRDQRHGNADGRGCSSGLETLAAPGKSAKTATSDSLKVLIHIESDVDAQLVRTVFESLHR
jgi:hypothetical protein